MKSALLFFSLTCLLAGFTPAHAMHGRHHSHSHRAHIKHVRYTHRVRTRAFHASLSQPERPAPVAELGAPHAITGLPLPPDDKPEFGATGSTTLVATTAAVPENQPQHITATASAPSQPRIHQVEEQAPRSVEVAMASMPPSTAHSIPLPAPAPAPVASTAMDNTPAATSEGPAAPLRFNHPTPIPLPSAPATVTPGADTPTAITPEHEDDDQPISMMTGGYGFSGISRVNHTRPFPALTPMRGYDIAASGTGVFGHTISASGIQSLAPGGGMFLTFHHHTDNRWLDIEAHYGLNDSPMQWSTSRANPATNVSLLAQEFTGDLLFRRHLNRARPYQALPYLGVGGGLLFLRPGSVLTSQLAPTALFDSGIDLPTNNQHISIRVGSHLLFYRTPNFGTTAASGWTLSAQPAAGVLFHF